MHVNTYRKRSASSSDTQSMSNFAMYTEEAVMINNSRRILSSGEEMDVIDKTKHLCLARGAAGILELARCFRIMDHDGNKHLSFELFQKGVHDIGLGLTQEEIKDLFDRFDNEGIGSINMTEFLNAIRPELSESRRNIVNQAFAKADRTGKGIISFDDLKHVYCVKSHPLYRSGEKTEEEILSRFLRIFEEHGHIDGAISQEEFANYYSGLSASIDDDSFFDLLIREEYKL